MNQSTEMSGLGSEILDTKYVYSINSSSASESAREDERTSRISILTWNMSLNLKDISQSLRITDFSLSDYRPKTELGRILLRLRRNYISSGGKLLSEAEFEEEIVSRRGGLR